MGSRSHPPTLLTLVLRAVKDEQLFGQGDRVLVAVSGGPDSMCLLHALALLRLKLGASIVAHGVDHGLRPAAAGELDAAEALAKTLDVPFDRTLLHVPAGGNLQARARSARYEALRAAATRSGCGVIATAHHLEDRAETVLLRLLRGAGPRGLAVLPARAGDLVRPMIRVSRQAIDAHLVRHEVPFARDPSNRDPRFLRVRVRHELLPLLRELSPGIDEHLCALADQLLPAREESRVPEPLAIAPRRSRNSVAALVAERSMTARVPLKGGLVARWDRASRSLAIESAPPLRPRSGSVTSTGSGSEVTSTGSGSGEADFPHHEKGERPKRAERGARSAPHVPRSPSRNPTGKHK
jgi:tRNA(Ile)-lysidine synthase